MSNVLLFVSVGALQQYAARRELAPDETYVVNAMRDIGIRTDDRGGGPTRGEDFPILNRMAGIDTTLRDVIDTIRHDSHHPGEQPEHTLVCIEHDDRRYGVRIARLKASIH